MNLNLKRKEIRQHYFSIGGLIIVNVLGAAGLLAVYSSGMFNIEDLNMLYECISKNGFVIIIGMFLFCVSLYCWVIFFLNIVLPPKKEIVYLKKIENGEAIFLNKKGKKFNYEINQTNLTENSYYFVLKTHDYIYEILERTNEFWLPKERKSYWLNYYSPMGKFEDVFLLPIVYVILLPGLLSILMSKGSQKIYGIIFSAIPLYAIIYDLIYKNKLKQSDGKEIDETNFIKSYEVLIKSISIILVGMMCIMILTVFFKLSDLTSKIIVLPFVGCGLCSLGLIISKVFQNYQLEKLFYKGYIIIFLIYYFGFLLFWTVGIVKQEENYLYVLFSIPFCLAGFLMLYKCIIKNK